MTAISQWHLYLIRCGDGSLYTGITTDVARRLADHRDGKGAKYLLGRKPLQVVFHQLIGERALAQRVEHRVKRLSKREKEALVQGRVSLACMISEIDLSGADHQEPT